LSPRQEAAALALASGASVVAAARKTGAGEPTIRTWLAQLPAFKQRINQLRADMTSRVVGHLNRAMVEAVGTLRKLLKHRSASMRRGAANDLLTHGPQFITLVELQARVEALEGL
jgi:transposase-like protein